MIKIFLTELYIKSIRDFRVAKISDRKYINLAKSTAFIKALASETGRTLTSYFFGNENINNFQRFCIFPFLEIEIGQISHFFDWKTDFCVCLFQSFQFSYDFFQFLLTIFHLDDIYMHWKSNVKNN